MMERSPAFAELIRTRRNERGLTQAELGRLVGRSASAVAGWERGRSLPGEEETLQALTAALSITRAELEGALDPDQLSFDATETLGGLVEGVLEDTEPTEEAPELDDEPPVNEPPVRGPGPVELAEPGIEPPETDAGAIEAPPEPETDTGPAETEPDTERLEAVTEPPETEPPKTAAEPIEEEPLEPETERETEVVVRRSGPVRAADRSRQPLSYLEDPEQVELYRVRYALTFVILLGLLAVAVWATGELRQALRAVMELF